MHLTWENVLSTLFSNSLIIHEEGSRDITCVFDINITSKLLDECCNIILLTNKCLTREDHCLALLYRTFSKFKIERKWVIPLTHLLSVSEALSGFQVYKTSYEFPACLAEKFYHNFYMAPTASVMTQMPAGSYAPNHFHCGLINLVKCWA